MNIIKNLKKENKKESYKLNTDNYVLINNIVQKMTIFKVNSYDALIIKKELIKIAQEMELKETTLKEELGDDLDSFAEDIINNSRGPNYLEIILTLLKATSLTFLAWFAFFSLIIQDWNWTSSIYTPIMLAAIIIFVYFLHGILTPIFALKKGFKKYIPNIVFLFMHLFIVLGPYKIYFTSGARVYSGYILVISLVIYLLSFFAYRKHISNLIKDAPDSNQNLLEYKINY